MNQENEQPTNVPSQYVLIDVGGSKELAIPMDSFIELNESMIVLESKGWGDDKEYNVQSKPVNFRMMSGEQMVALQAKARLLADREAKQGKKT